MKVLHLSTFDRSGGAARAAYRIHDGLNKIGVESQMLVRNKSSNDKTVVEVKSASAKVSGKLRADLNTMLLKRSYPKSNKSEFSPQWLPDRLASEVDKLTPDLVNLHWISNGYLQIETIAKFQQPVVWTLMDMWSFTGGCHYARNCDRYQNSCGACPQLHSQQETDLSRKVWQRKLKAWQNINLTIVSPTSWLANCARASSLFRDKRIEIIPFGLDTKIYKPIDKQTARRALNLPLDKKLVLFGAIEATKDRRKGFHLLQSALQKLGRSHWSQQIELVVFGSSRPKDPIDLGFNQHYLGRLSDDISLALVYSAADVMLAPSTQEAFGQTASESLACGTPAIAFAGTGLADIIDHQQNGYLARPFEAEDLAHGIAWVLEDEDRHRILSQQAREKVEREFSLEIQAHRYFKLYSEILGDR